MIGRRGSQSKLGFLAGTESWRHIVKDIERLNIKLSAKKETTLYDVVYEILTSKESEKN
jgi:hypothetical protein